MTRPVHHFPPPRTIWSTGFRTKSWLPGLGNTASIVRHSKTIYDTSLPREKNHPEVGYSAFYYRIGSVCGEILGLEAEGMGFERIEG